MSTLVAIVYPSEQKAEEVRNVVFDLAKRYLIKFSDVVIATRDDKGRVKLNQLFNTTASGAAGGSFWGLLIGLIFLNPLLGAVAGAAGGAIRQHLIETHPRHRRAIAHNALKLRLHLHARFLMASCR